MVAPLSAEEVSYLAQRDLGITVEPGQIGAPQECLYLGFDSFYFTYQIDGKSVCINPLQKRALLKENLSFNLATPERLREIEREWGVLHTAQDYVEYLDINVPRQCQDPPGYSNTCAPTSGAMISEFYRESSTRDI